MTKWQFRTLDPNDTSGASTAEDNFAQEERTKVDILVRECIQNPLDARVPGAVVHVSFKWRALVAENSAFVRDLFTPEFCAQQGSADGVESLTPPEEMTLLVIEDFGTTGLCGAFDNSTTDGATENWNAFWFREGEGAKPTKANGGAGQGKLTLYIASKYRTVVALTKRNSDGLRLLFGSCRFRRNYVLNGERYAREARWGVADAPGLLSKPAVDHAVLDRYEAELGINRSESTGTSFLIPAPDPEINSNAVASAVINEFFFPILRGTLTVEVDGVLIASNTIVGLAGNYASTLRYGPAFRNFLFEIATQNLDQTEQHLVVTEKWADCTKLLEEHLGTASIEQLRLAFKSGQVVAASFPIRVSPRKHPAVTGHLKVFVKEASADEVQELFIRQDLAVDKEKSLRSAKRLMPSQALTLIDDNELSRFLAAAEEPTHREWNGTRPKLERNYANAPKTLRLVRNAASRLLELLAPPAEKDSFALASFFPDVAVRKENVKAKQPKKSGATDGDDQAEVDIPAPVLRKLELKPLDDGAHVRVNPAAAATCTFPMTCKLELAYATEFGKPFDQWDAADFYMSERSHKYELRAGSDLAPKGNHVEFVLDGAESEFSVTGFDKNRQLEMRLKYLEHSNADHI